MSDCWGAQGELETLPRKELRRGDRDRLQIVDAWHKNTSAEAACPVKDQHQLKEQILAGRFASARLHGDRNGPAPHGAGLFQPREARKSRSAVDRETAGSRLSRLLGRGSVD